MLESEDVKIFQPLRCFTFEWLLSSRIGQPNQPQALFIYLSIHWMPQTTGIIHIFVSLLYKVYMNLHMEKLHMGADQYFHNHGRTYTSRWVFYFVSINLHFTDHAVVKNPQRLIFNIWFQLSLNRKFRYEFSWVKQSHTVRHKEIGGKNICNMVSTVFKMNLHGAE